VSNGLFRGIDAAASLKSANLAGANLAGADLFRGIDAAASLKEAMHEGREPLSNLVEIQGSDFTGRQGPMPSFQFRKMRCYGHIGCLLSQIVGGVCGR
jgi:uncharacterized protein YjbI with pentapeptide repeats